MTLCLDRNGKSKGPDKQKGRPEAAFSTNAAGRRSMIVVMAFMIMVMIVVMMLMRLVIIVFVALDQTGKLVAIHALVGSLAKAGDVIDDLVLEHRRAQASQGLRVLAVEVVDLLLLAREAAHLGDQRLLVLVIGDLDVVLVADLGDHQAQPHAALGDLAILFARLFLGRPFILEGAAMRLNFMLDVLPDIRELGLDELLGHLELVAGIERV